MAKKDELIYWRQERLRLKKKLRRALKQYEQAQYRVNDLEEELLKTGEV